MTPADLAAWMHEHDLNKTDLSRITGVARTTIDRYLAGAYPIPKLFKLACRGIDYHVAQHGSYDVP
jgi:hypothetical protein